MTAPMIAAAHHHLLKKLALSLTAAFASVAIAEECAQVPAIAEAAAADGAIRWSGCHLEVNANGDTELTGKVVVQVAGREMHCEHLSYQALSHDLRLSGSVRYQDTALRVTGEAGHYGTLGAQFSHAQFELLQHPGRGEADSVSTTTPGVVELGNVTYTTCPKGSADWQLQAHRITLDTKALRGVGHGTRVIFKGVPIIYLPWISFPLSSARQSGFLFPAIGSSSSGGATLSVPWYWNIAPNQDLTLVPTIYTRRGLSLGTEYRVLSPFGTGLVRADYLPSDHISGHDRSELWVTGTRNFAQGWRAQINAQTVSDTHYFEDFSSGPEATSIVFLPRDLHLTLRGDVWQLGAQALKFQVLDSPLFLPTADQPYAELPRLTAAARWQATSGIGTQFESELTDFQRDVGTTGWRGRFQPGVSYTYSRPGFYLRPQASWDLTTYRLSHADSTHADTTPARSLPIVTVDTALKLERTSGSGGTRLITLEPRLNYVYIPYRNQDDLPLFDTGLPDPNFVALYRANRYAGFDRIGDANNLTAGMTLRMLQSKTGQQYLSAMIGQTLHFSAPRVTLPGETPDTRKRSDLLANIDLTAYRNWNLHYDLAWDPDQSRTGKSLLGLQYRLAGDQVINLGYRFTRGSVEQAEASAAWPVSRRWDLYGRSVYSLQDRRSIENFAGVQYRENCWGLRLVVRDSVSRTANRRDTGWYLQLELKGLSSVGSGADSFLQGSIQGYSPR